MTTNAKITLLFFAQLSEISQETQIQYPIEPQETAHSLYQKIQKKYHLPYTSAQLRAARNHQFCDWQTKIQDNDIIAFIPPVAGG